MNVKSKCPKWQILQRIDETCRPTISPNFRMTTGLLVQDLFFLQPNCSKRRFQQYVLTWMLGIKIPLMFLRDPKTEAFINFLEFIEQAIERSTEDWRIEQRTILNFPEFANGLRGLIKFSAYGVMIRFLHGPERTKDLLIDEYSKVAIKRHLWKRLGKINIYELDELFIDVKAEIIKVLQLKGLDVPSVDIRRELTEQAMQIVPFDGAIMVPYQNETGGNSNRNPTENNLRGHDQSAAQTQLANGTSVEPRHSNDEGQENIEGQQADQNESEYQILVPIENEPTSLNNFNPQESLLRQSCSVDENAQLRNRNDFDEMFNPPCRKGSVTDDDNHHQTTATKRTKFSSPTDNGCLTTIPTDNFDKELDDEYPGLFNNPSQNFPEENDEPQSSPESPPGYSSSSDSDSNTDFSLKK